MPRYFPVSVYDPHWPAEPDAAIIGRINDALAAAREGYRLVPLDLEQFVREKPKQRGRRKKRR